MVRPLDYIHNLVEFYFAGENGDFNARNTIISQKQNKISSSVRSFNLRGSLCLFIYLYSTTLNHIRR
jgi:hypothetical protein